jgi:hypothetical protein
MWAKMTLPGIIGHVHSLGIDLERFEPALIACPLDDLVFFFVPFDFLEGFRQPRVFARVLGCIGE